MTCLPRQSKHTRGGRAISQAVSGVLWLATACLFSELNGPKSSAIQFSLFCDSLGVAVHCSGRMSLGDSLRFTDSANSLGAGPNQMRWTSTNPAIATIDSAGLARGLQLGYDTIIATLIAPERDTTLRQPLRVLQLADPDSSCVIVGLHSINAGDSTRC